jgi:hypothetical protein
MPLCAHCGNRIGTEQFYNDPEGALGWIHCRAQWWCRVCVLEAQIEHCQKAVARLPELLAALESAKSVDAVDPSAGIRER